MDFVNGSDTKKAGIVLKFSALMTRCAHAQVKLPRLRLPHVSVFYVQQITVSGRLPITYYKGGGLF